MYAAQPFALLGTIVEEYIESGTPSQIITEQFGVKKFLLNGQMIFQSQAPALFAKKGWSGSRILQDRSGRFAIQVGNGYSMGGRGGSATHTLTEAELPIIRPKMQATNTGGATGEDGSRLKAGSTGGLGTALLSDGGTFTITTSQSFGGGQSHNNLPPYVVTASYLIGW
jgi:microcystin-dependent protein